MDGVGLLLVQLNEALLLSGCKPHTRSTAEVAALQPQGMWFGCRLHCLFYVALLLILLHCPDVRTFFLSSSISLASPPKNVRNVGRSESTLLPLPPLKPRHIFYDGPPAEFTADAQRLRR